MNELSGISEELTAHMGCEFPEPAGIRGRLHGGTDYFFVGASFATDAAGFFAPL